MIFIKKYLPFTFVFLSLLTRAQTGSELKTILTNGLEQYRQELIAGAETKIQALKHLSYLWENVDSKHANQLANMLFKLMYS